MKIARFPTPDELEEIYWQEAEKLTRLVGGFSISCEDMVRRHIRKAVHRMAREGALDDSQRLVLAKDNIVRLMTVLASSPAVNAKPASSGMRQIQDADYLKALDRCPVWPIR